MSRPSFLDSSFASLLFFLPSTMNAPSSSGLVEDKSASFPYPKPPFFFICRMMEARQPFPPPGQSGHLFLTSPQGFSPEKREASSLHLPYSWQEPVGPDLPPLFRLCCFFFPFRPTKQGFFHFIVDRNGPCFPPHLLETFRSLFLLTEREEIFPVFLLSSKAGMRPTTSPFHLPFRDFPFSPLCPSSSPASKERRR